MIYKHPKKPVNSGTYHRTKAQKKRENPTVLGDSERSYAKSEFDAPPIEYNNTGSRI